VRLSRLRNITQMVLRVFALGFKNLLDRPES
jgi:hypothetical protein